MSTEPQKTAWNVYNAVLDTLMVALKVPLASTDDNIAKAARKTYLDARTAARAAFVMRTGVIPSWWIGND